MDDLGGTIIFGNIHLVRLGPEKHVENVGPLVNP